MTIVSEEKLYLGLMSGTSADAVDAAIIAISSDGKVRVQHASAFAMPKPLQQQILALGQGQTHAEIDALGALDIALGELFAASALQLLERSGVAAEQITAIGSHGQTIRHRPRQAQSPSSESNAEGPWPFSWQIGCAHVIAERTGIDVVADFRRRDVAAGGQGAPLVPAFHRAVFPDRSAVLNLGGIANVSCLLGEQLQGFDTGPANCLLDAHAQLHFGRAMDAGGVLAAQGNMHPGFVAHCLADPYFHLTAPKSTGREYFNLAWLARQQQSFAAPLSALDVQASLLELSAASIAAALAPFALGEVWACGGGVHNLTLMRALQAKLPIPLRSSAEMGIDPDFVEAAAFAWFAHAHLKRIPANVPAVTGAPLRVLGAWVPGNA